MSTISQTIPNYVLGISEQPDQLKTPGQVRDLVNAIPDVTLMCGKRPGSEVIGEIGNLDAADEQKWFSIDNSKYEQYIGRVSTDGTVNVNRLVDSSDPFLRVSTNGSGLTDGTYYNLASTTTGDGTGLTADVIVSNGVVDVAYIRDFGQNYETGDIVIIEVDNSNIQFYYFRCAQFVQDKYDANGTRVYGRNYTAGIKTTTSPTGSGLTVDISVDSNGDVTSATIVNPGNGNYQSNDEITVDGAGFTPKIVRQYIGTWSSTVNDWIVNNPLTTSGIIHGIVSTTQYDVIALFFAGATSYLLASNVRDNLVSAFESNDTQNKFTFTSGLDQSNSAEPNRPYFEVQLTSPYSSTLGVNPGNSNNVTWQGGAPTITQQYIAPISHPIIYKTGEAGEDMLVTYEGNAKSYMANNEPATKIKNLTIDDYTYFVNRDKAVTMDSTQRSPAYGNKGFVNIINLSDGKDYSFTIVEKSGSTTTKYRIASGAIAATSNTNAFVILSIWMRNLSTATSSTTDFSGEFQGDAAVTTASQSTAQDLSAYTFKILGNGLLITSATKEFSLETTDTQLMTVFTNSVQNISLLPTQCSHGYKALVANSDTVDDDYYVQFVGREEQDGIGYWEETTGSNILTTIDKDTMPHQMRRNANATFTISPIDYTKRLVGDDVTNKPPSFVGGYTPEGETTAIGNKYINNIVNYRNRLGFLSGDNVILSRPEDFFNFFNKTSLTISPDDPIDIAVSDTQPATLYDAIESNVGLVLFSRNQQFLMTTDGDALTPATVRATFLSSYLYNENVSPISLGTTQAFVKDDGRNTQFFEMQQQRRDGEPQLLELSKIISNKLPSGINILSNARGSGTVLMSKKGSNELWGHRYFNTGEERVQSSWFRFEMADSIYYHCIIRDVIYSAQKLNNELTIQKMDLKRYDDSTTYANDAYNYRVHLDNRFSVYNAGSSVSGSLCPYTLVNGSIDYYHEETGLFGTLTVENNSIDLSSYSSIQQGEIHFGNNYEMKVSFPTIYPTQDQGNQVRADVTGSLTLHRIKLSCGQTGKFDVFMKRKGRNDLTLGFDATVADSFTLDDQAFLPERVETIPVYDRNTNTFISFKSNYPTPATLISMTWEGDYVNRLYARA